jgi:peptidoglycan/LPS O-acetylase OafA/YrhL
MGGLTTWLISIDYRTSYMETFGDQAKYAYFYIYNFMTGIVIKDASFLLEHFWSLSVEEQFYIFWPFVLLFTPERHYKKLFIGMILLGPVFRLGMLILQNSGAFSFFTHTVPETINPLPFSHMDAFAFGAYISCYSIPKAKMQFIIMLGLLPIAGFSAQYFSTGEPVNPSSLGYPVFMPNSYQFIWGYSLLAYFFALTIHLVVQHGLFLGILESPPLRYSGKISYGLYVYHQPITWFATDIQQLGFVETDLVKPVATLIAFLGTLLIASISYHFMEKPLLNLKDRFFPLKEDRT